VPDCQELASPGRAYTTTASSIPGFQHSPQVYLYARLIGYWVPRQACGSTLVARGHANSSGLGRLVQCKPCMNSRPAANSVPAQTTTTASNVPAPPIISTQQRTATATATTSPCLKLAADAAAQCKGPPLPTGKQRSFRMEI
jgi:hypothetical protein